MSSTFCSNCGKPKDPNSTFCAECGVGGAPNTPNANNNGNMPSNPMAKLNTGDMNTKIGIGVVGLVVLIILVMVFNLFFGSGNPDVVAKKAVNAIVNYDGEAIYKLTHKGSMEEYLSSKKIKEDDYIESLTDDFNYLIDRYAATIDVSTRKFNEYVEIIDTDEDEYSDREFDDILDTYDRYTDIKIKKATIIEFELECEGDDDSLDFELTIPLIKVGSKWYLDILSYE